MHLILPIPPNANNYRGVSWKHRRFYLRPEAKAYHRHVQAVCWQAGITKPSEERFDVTLRVFRPARRGDTDGYSKVLLDALQGFVYVNDRQVRDLHVIPREDKENPRVEVDLSVVIDLDRALDRLIAP